MTSKAGDTPRMVALTPWRAVEGQDLVATMRLVDTIEEQDLLEQILEEGKPPAPVGLSRLHYLIATPFRYPPQQHGSRFRAPADPGVFYAAESIRAACA